MDWHIITSPGWFLEQGWALTPEIAGITERDGWGPHREPSVGWVRRRAGDAMMMIGGRHLGGDPTASASSSALDDRPLATFDVRPGFLPASSSTFRRRRWRATGDVTRRLDGQRARPARRRRSAASRSSSSTCSRPIVVQFGFDEGWYEPEYNPPTAQSWRWMSERAVVRVHTPAGDVTLRSGRIAAALFHEAAAAPRQRPATACWRRSRPTADFTTEVAIPADALAAANGRVVLTSDHVLHPRRARGHRRPAAPGARIYSVAS